MKTPLIALALFGLPLAANAQTQPTTPASSTTSPAPSLAPEATVSPAPAGSAEPVASPAATAPSAAPAADAGPQRRALPAPLDPVFPSADFLGPTIGVPNDTTVYPLQKKLFPKSDGNGVRVYGWLDIGALGSTSQHSSFPQTYNVDPNMVNVDQLVVRVERQPDTTQTAHGDWGFRVSTLFGIDYRWTTAEGYFSGQLLQHNQLYGVDPVEAYGILYAPRLGQGTTFQIGRYISPPDIEAQLSPNNYLYSHSVFFDFDAYTQTGILAATKLSNYWTLQYGIHSGSDDAPWDASAHFPTGQVIARYVSHSNRNSLLFGIDSLNASGAVKSYVAANNQLFAHDNLQQENFTWTHVFNSKLHNSAETYYLYTFNAYAGGTINNGPSRFGGGGGAGAFLPGRSVATGGVDYLEYAFTPTDFMSFRTDYMNDQRGWRSGFPTSYGSLTYGITHKISNSAMLRPEIRYEQAFQNGVNPYDNGTRHTQTSVSMDYILNF